MDKRLGNLLFVEKTVEFDALLRGPSWRGMTSRGLALSDFVVEEHTCEPGERPESISERYILALWSAPGTGQMKYGRSSYARYLKPPGSLTFVPPGIVPPVVPDNKSELVCCSIETSLVNEIKDSMDQRPPQSIFYRTGINDASLRQLMYLLVKEIKEEVPLGKLYADHLVHAMILRLLSLGNAENRNARSPVSPLPASALRRVLERMQTLSPELDLRTLAAESRYSRRHFLRMFERATGYTPHRYLLKLRLERAQKLLKSKSPSLIDVAVECGFSSQSHMSKVFRRMLGLTPGEYRRHVGSSEQSLGLRS
jgi:AraC family transcriptional regulator